MKKIERIAIVSQRIVLFACVVFGIAVITLFGCGEEDDPVDFSGSAPTDMLGGMKAPEMVAAAPTAPQTQVPEGTPTVKSVGYYSDWQLTQPLSGMVSPGTTFFVKIVFSEAMKFKAGDDNSARPILYYRVGREQHRFRVAEHGASGEDFVIGDAKPLGSGTDDYICKYTVPADATKKFRVEIGKFNADLEGNNLPAFYRHDVQLQFGEPEEEAEESTEPTTPESETPVETTPESADTTAPTVVSITHYQNSVPIAEGETVPPGTTIDTEVVFSEPVTPKIAYSTGRQTKTYGIWQSGVHWRGLCKPTDASKKVWLCKQNARRPSFVVTIEPGTVDLAGNHLAEAVISPTLAVQQAVPAPDTTPTEPTPPEPVTPIEPPPTGDPFSGYVYVPPVEFGRSHSQPIGDAAITIISGTHAGQRATTNQSGQYTFPNITEDALRVRVTKSGFETKEVVVSRLRPTTINGRASSYEGDPQNTPGNIVIGHAWPDRVRPILQQLAVPHDLLYVEVSVLVIGGVYRSPGGCVLVNRAGIERNHGIDGFLFICAHEIFHAHQHNTLSSTLSNDPDQIAKKWAHTTTEGGAFVEARAKDWATVGKAEYDTLPRGELLYENAANTFAAWWGLRTGQWSLQFIENLKQDAPNRWQWAEKHFGHIVR